jgi:hypothetical protein
LENGSLIISRATQEHEGYYLCQAGNGIGPGLSKVILLTVHGKSVVNWKIILGIIKYHTFPSNNVV